MPMSMSPRPLSIFSSALAVLALTTGAGNALSETPAPETPAPETPAPEARELSTDLRQLISEARDQVFPALVNVEVLQVGYYGGEEVKGRSFGSGTIISAQGHVLTNYHVTSGGHTFTCTLADRQELEATLVGDDPLTDLAVLQLDLSALEGELPVAALGDSSAVEVGDHVLAMGSPFALSRSVTLGIVSNAERVFAGGLDRGGISLGSGEQTGLFTRWIQHDALINPGNSGGPLVSLEGKVIGVNELGGNSIGFAIPANLAQEVAQTLIEHGQVPRSKVGASFLPIRDPALPKGALVSSLESDGPAADGGLEAGDVITTIDAQAVDLRFSEEVPNFLKGIAALPVGTSMVIGYSRAGELGEATVVTEALDRDQRDEASFRSWGFTARNLSPRLVVALRRDSDQGVYITGVRSGSPAQLAEPPIAAGDVLLTLGSKPLKGLLELQEMYEDFLADPQERRDLVAEVERDGNSLLTLLRSKADDDQDRPRELPKAWMGAATQPLLPRLSEHLGFGGTAGFRVTRVYPGTRAAESELAVGDIILALEGEVLAPRGMQDSGLLNRRIQRLDIGSEAALTILREGERREISVPLDRSRITPQEARRDKDRDFELEVREITFFDRDERHWDRDVGGVLVDSVEPAGWAGLGGLRSGDLVQRFGAGVVKDIKSYREALAAALEARQERVTVFVLRGGRSQYLSLEPDWGR